ncbi:hypothetical protein [Natrinema soli]|uniref:Uncharacterized protein n=1 Tax=Natrinema soli TaxID=1930624 RepID=A0ABD5STQ7_9EURY|nr:hypothetical protein [Natrinema soli]
MDLGIDTDILVSDRQGLLVAGPLAEASTRGDSSPLYSMSFSSRFWTIDLETGEYQVSGKHIGTLNVKVEDGERWLGI